MHVLHTALRTGSFADSAVFDVILHDADDDLYPQLAGLLHAEKHKTRDGASEVVCKAVACPKDGGREGS